MLSGKQERKLGLNFTSETGGNFFAKLRKEFAEQCETLHTYIGT